MVQLLVTANVLGSLILFILMMEAILSSELSIPTRATWHHIPEDGILQVISRLLAPLKFI
jgi:hypothetical protein